MYYPSDLNLEEINIESGIVIDTQYPVEKFSFNWKISNYSKIINDVYATFSTTLKATEWRLRLSKCREAVELRRCFDGEPVLVVYECNARLPGGTATLCNSNGEQRLGARSGWIYICDIPRVFFSSSSDDNPIKFENDVFDLHCTLTILGHAMTHITRNPNLFHNTKQIGTDLENLLNMREHSDLTVRVGRKEIPVHKAILCARSPVFNKMFQHDMLERNTREIAVEDSDFDIIQFFVSFLYSGKVDLCWDKAMKLYYVADKYQVNDLQKICSQFLQQNLTVDRVSPALKLANRHKDEELKKAVLFYILTRSSSDRQRSTWNDLIQSDPGLIDEIAQ